MGRVPLDSEHKRTFMVFPRFPGGPAGASPVVDAPAGLRLQPLEARLPLPSASWRDALRPRPLAGLSGGSWARSQRTWALVGSASKAGVESPVGQVQLALAAQRPGPGSATARRLAGAGANRRGQVVPDQVAARPASAGCGPPAGRPRVPSRSRARQRSAVRTTSPGSRRAAAPSASTIASARSW